jgi:hypothetical protein
MKPFFVRRFVPCCLLIVAARLSIAPTRAATTTPTEYEVKAVFIYNFAKYIQWPASTTADAKRRFVIVVVGKDPFGPVLDEVMRGHSVQGRPVAVRRLERLEDVGNCDILFVASSERVRLQQILEVSRTAPVLTVGDMDQFAQRGGMINLTTEENRIRFEINVKAIERVGLKASSQLLRLARIVTESRSAGY